MTSICSRTPPDEAAVAGERRQLVVERPLEHRGERRQIAGEGEPGPLDLLWQFGNSRHGPAGGAQANTDLAGPGDGGADRREIARPAAAERQAGQRPADVGRFGQRRPAIPPQHRIVRK